MKRYRLCVFALILIISWGGATGWVQLTLEASPDRPSDHQKTDRRNGDESNSNTPDQEREPPPPSTIETSNVPKRLRGHDRYYRIEFVFDGDSVKLTNDKQLRLIGVDSPEKSRDFADEARSFVRGILEEGTLIAVDFDRMIRDRYDRLLGYVFVIKNGKRKKTDKIMMNEELLRRGLAHTYLHKLNTRKADQLISAQREAIREGRKLFQEIDETSEQYYRVHSAYRYHRTGCKYVRDIPDRELEVFKSRKEALLRGYNGASCCFRGE